MKYRDIPLEIVLPRGTHPRSIYPECEWSDSTRLTDPPWEVRWIKGFPDIDDSPEIIDLWINRKREDK